MADKTITYSKSIVTQKAISVGDNTAYITQISKPIILKGVSTKTCQNVLYSIDGLNFTEETTIGDDNVLSMAIVPFWLGGTELDSDASVNISPSMVKKAFSYILGERNINEDIIIDDPISEAKIRANGAYRYLLQYLAKNKDKIEWDTGDLFTSLDADKQESFGGSDFITDKITINRNESSGTYPYILKIDKQTDANGSILKPKIIAPAYSVSNNVITIQQSPYFFLYPEACPPSNENPDKLIIDNFWRGGGLLESNIGYVADISNVKREMFILYIFAVS